MQLPAIDQQPVLPMPILSAPSVTQPAQFMTHAGITYYNNYGYHPAHNNDYGGYHGAYVHPHMQQQLSPPHIPNYPTHAGFYDAYQSTASHLCHQQPMGFGSSLTIKEHLQQWMPSMQMLNRACLQHTKLPLMPLQPLMDHKHYRDDFNANEPSWYRLSPGVYHPFARTNHFLAPNHPRETRILGVLDEHLVCMQRINRAYAATNNLLTRYQLAVSYQRQLGYPLTPIAVYYTPQAMYIVEPILFGHAQQLLPQLTAQERIQLALWTFESVLPWLALLHQNQLAHGAIAMHHFAFFHEHVLLKNFTNVTAYQQYQPDPAYVTANTAQQDPQQHGLSEDIFAFGRSLLEIITGFSLTQAKPSNDHQHHAQGSQPIPLTLQRILEGIQARDLTCGLKGTPTAFLQILAAMCDPIAYKRPTAAMLMHCIRPKFQSRFQSLLQPIRHRLRNHTKQQIQQLPANMSCGAA